MWLARALKARGSRWSVAVGAALLFCVGSPPPLVGQEAAGTASLRGTVVAEEGGSPLAGVSVELVGQSRKRITDDFGRFDFDDVPLGSHTLRFHLIGRAFLERTVRLDSPGVHRREVSLGASPVSVQPLMVLLNRTRAAGSLPDEVPGSVQVLGAKTLRESPAVFDDVHSLLREVPGVHLQEEDGYGLRPNVGMRGTGSERSSKITLMEDGVLIAPAPYAAPAAYYFPLAGRMEAIEVRKGSSQILYGPSTIGGALNLVSSSIPSDFSVEAEAAGGTDDTRKMHVRAGGSGERVGWLLEGYRLETDGFKRLDGGGSTGFDLQDYVGKLRLSTDLDAPVYQQVELKLAAYDERSDETYLGLTEADFEVDPFRRYAASQEDVMRADHQQMQLRHFLRLQSGLDVTTTAYWHAFARNWYKLQSVLGEGIADVLSDPGSHATALDILRGSSSEDDALRVRANNRDYLSRGVQTAVAVPLGAAGTHELQVGARIHADEEDRFQHEDAFAMDAGRMVLTTSGDPGSQANRVSSAEALSLYAQDRIRVGKVTLTPGLRYEHIDFERRDYEAADAQRRTPSRVRRNTVSAWIPGIGANLRASDRVRIFGGVHRGFGPPGPGADRETDPESSVNYELGARLSGTGLRAQLVGFYSDYGNILGAATLATGTEGTGDLFNGGEVSVWGVEASLSYDPLARADTRWRLPVQLTYTGTRARFETSFDSDFGPWGTVEPGDALPYLPEHQFFARVTLERGRWSAGVTASGTSAARTVAGRGPIPEAERVDPFVVLGLSARHEVASGLTAYGAVQNLGDASYVVARRPAGARPGLPRTLELGVRVSR